ncbi:MAG: META domain-containing protein [Chloroflexota bacterium]
MKAAVMGLSKTLTVVLLVAAFLATLAGCSLARSPLEGTRWRLVGWTISSLDPASVTISAHFAEGRISGTSAVNSYGGPYTVGPGNAFSIGQMVSTAMGGPEPAMRAESIYLTLLGQARSYKVADDKLTLYDAGGNESLIFQRSEQ